MKIQSATITNASGSIGGMTAAKNRGGLYLRARAAVTNPQTAGQTLIRTVFSAASTAWRTLTSGQQEGWTNYALNSPRTNFAGDPLILTGSQMYIALNTPRMQAGIDPVATPPTVFGLPPTPYQIDPATCVITGPAVALTVSIKIDPPQMAGDTLLYVSKPQSPSTKFFKGPYNLMGTQPIAANSGGADVEADESTLPAVAVGQVLYYRITYSQDDGRLSGAVVGSVIVT